MPDVSGILLVAGSWAPSLVLNVMPGKQDVAFLLACIVSMLAIVDYCLKLHWKFEQRRKERAARKAGKTLKNHETDTNDNHYK